VNVKKKNLIISDLIGEICPNIRVLRLRSRYRSIEGDSIEGDSIEILRLPPILVELSGMASKIRFPQLNSFSLDGEFDLKDGTFLLLVLSPSPLTRLLCL